MSSCLTRDGCAFSRSHLLMATTTGTGSRDSETKTETQSHRKVFVSKPVWVHTLTASRFHSFTPSHTLLHTLTPSLLHTRSFTHSLLHSFTHSLLHSFTPSLADIHTHRPLAAAAWRMDSRVWGITPSSAATTSTTMSVALAPLARMALNASCPGVSRNVMVLPLVSGTVDIWTGRENRWRFRIHETNAPFCWF